MILSPVILPPAGVWMLFDPEEIRDCDYIRDKRRGSYQVTIGLMMTQAGLPLCHYVFSGNTTDKSTVCGIIKDINGRFGIKDVALYLVNRGMLSGKDLDMITDKKLRFIISYPLRGDNAVCHMM